MKFEQLIDKYKYNNKKKKRIKTHLRAKHNTKQKLKLGALLFQINEIVFLNFKLYETVTIRFLRQDDSDDFITNFNKRLNSLKWKWDFYNIFSFILFFSFFIMVLYFYIDYFYKINLYDHRINTSLIINLINIESIFFKKSFDLNVQFNNILIELMDYYSILN